MLDKQVPQVGAINLDLPLFRKGNKFETYRGDSGKSCAAVVLAPVFDTRIYPHRDRSPLGHLRFSAAASVGVEFIPFF